ncbi:MAG TPA: YciI family protein [Gemmatimonadaceae bacterium]|jgi:hypothetical protein
MTEAFCDALAPFYHLIYPDWEASSRRQSAALVALLREFDIAPGSRVRDAAVGIGTHSEPPTEDSSSDAICRFYHHPFDVRVERLTDNYQGANAMRYMMFVKHPKDYDMSEVPPALFGPMGEFVAESMKNGTMLDGAGLKPLAKATRVRIDGDRIKVTDGPFSEAKEVVGGYALFDLKTHEEAVDLARKFMELHRIYWPDFKGECELRPLEDMEPPQS